MKFFLPVIAPCILVLAVIDGPRPAKSRPVPASTMINSLTMVNGAAFVTAGLSGKHVKIGIVDAGFSNADKDLTLSAIFREKRIGGWKDYIRPGKDGIFTNHSEMDWHGTQVLSLIGGRDAQGKIYGLAGDATFYLSRTDDGSREYAREQVYFSQALDWLQSKGVRLVNASLGYAYGFDDPAENYLPENMDGKTTLISKSCGNAIVHKNMIIVTSAGNDGDNVWKIISAPADVRNAIAVGATDDHLDKRTFSSEGPDFLDYLKPDISCLNYTGGTSFSAPVITGMIACMLEKDPGLTAARIKDMLQRSAHLYPYGNNFEGYGVPDAARILQLMKDPQHDFKRSEAIKASGNTVSIPLSGSDIHRPRLMTLFHKMNKWIVLKQENAPQPANTATITRPAGFYRSRLVVDDRKASKYHTADSYEKVARTTVVTDDKVFEIIWP